MNFSSLTGLDVAILFVLAVSITALIVCIFHVVSFNKKLCDNANINSDITVRFRAECVNEPRSFRIVESRDETRFGKVIFVQEKSEEELKQIEGDIIVNGIPADSAPEGLTEATSGFLEILNNTSTDLIIENLTFYPGNIPGNFSFTADALMNTLFTHAILAKGQITKSRFAIKMSELVKERMNADLTLSRHP